MASKRVLTRGFTLLEVTVCAAMLAALLTLLGKTITAVERQLRATGARAQAMRTAENLLEQALSAPWDDVDDERIRSLPLPEELLRQWPKAQLVGQVTPLEGPPAGKRVTVSLLGVPGSRLRPVTLTTWIFKAPEGR